MPYHFNSLLDDIVLYVDIAEASGSIRFGFFVDSFSLSLSSALILAQATSSCSYERRKQTFLYLNASTVAALIKVPIRVVACSTPVSTSGL